MRFAGYPNFEGSERTCCRRPRRRSCASPPIIGLAVQYPAPCPDIRSLGKDLLTRGLDVASSVNDALMPRISMRWWLALTFGAIVALTAITVAQVLTIRSEAAFKGRARELAAGTAVTAAAAITTRDSDQGVTEATRLASQRRRVALFVFDGTGALITDPSSNGLAVSSISDLRAAVDGALQGHRTVSSVDGDRRIVVALPLQADPGAALVSVASRPDLVAAGDIVRGQLWRTLTIAIAIGALIGTSIAVFITARLRRIGRAAAKIETGNFDEPLEAGFHDELGDLAESVEHMRLRLRDLFGSLESERDRLRDLLEQLQEGVIAVDASPAVVFANSRAKLMVGRRRLATGAPLPDLWPGVDLHSFVESLFDERSQGSTFRVSPQEGFTFAVAGIPARQFNDTALLVITDVTVTARRERAEREFVANAAHELRTPLATITAAIDVLQSGAKGEPDTRDYFLTVIDRQSERLNRLVQSLLALARAQTLAEPLAVESVDVDGLLNEVAADLPDGAVTTDCEHPLTVLVHRELLRHAVENLAANALRHANGCPVQLEAHEAAGSTVRIEVLDRGPGIEERERELVFDRFYRGDNRDGNGFGLGLSIVNEIVSALGGEIEMEPRPGGGTVAAIVVQRAD